MTALFAALGMRMIQYLGAGSPWTNAIGLGRSLIALSTLLSLALNPADYIFRPGAGVPAIGCDAIAGRISVFCMFPERLIEISIIISCVILFLVVIGWQPRLTAIPHWWISCSAFESFRATDGGDQAAAVITLLLVPVLLFDPRAWHWQKAIPNVRHGVASAIAFISLMIVQLQVALIYFDAFSEKLGIPEWTDGTNMFYIFRNNMLGAPHYLSQIILPLTAGPMVTFFTWSPLIVEFFLAINIFLNPVLRRIVLFVGVVFHLGILVMLGITSFAIIMIGTIIIGVCPIGRNIDDFIGIASAGLTRDATPSDASLMIGETLEQA